MYKRTSEKNVIIIGAGASGLMAAVWAARGGASVTVLEHGDRAGRKLILTGSGKCNFTNMLLSRKRISGETAGEGKTGTDSYRGSALNDAEAAVVSDTKAFKNVVMEHYHGDPEFAASAIEAFDAEDTVEFFRELGVEPAYRRYPYDEGIYVYPASMEAGSVLRALMDECERLGVHFVYGCEPKHISCRSTSGQQAEDNEKCCGAMSGSLAEAAGGSEEPKHTDEGKEKGTSGSYEERKYWKIETSCGEFEADSVIFAAGSNAAPKTGSDSSIYPLIKELKHDFSPFMAALCGLKTEAGALEMLKGVRTEAGVSLHVYSDNDMMLYQSRGEVQISSEGISGVCVMNISRYAAIALKRGYDVELSLRLLPWLSEDELRDYVKSCVERDGGKIRPETLAGALPLKLSKYIVEQSGLTEQGLLKSKDDERTGHKDVLSSEDRRCSGMGNAAVKAVGYTRGTDDIDKAVERITGLLSDLRFRIKKTAGFDHSQAASGGVSTLQIDESTMESRLHKGIYFCGELLDVDGSCGGYNLQFSWSSGKIAGSAAAYNC